MMCKESSALRLSVVTAMAMASCVPLRDPSVTGPEGESDLTVSASIPVGEVFEGATVMPAAEAKSGTPPYLFRWDQNGGPAEIAIANATGTTISAGPLGTPGTYVFRVVVTDSVNAHATDYVTVQVISAVTASVPSLAVVGEPVMLTATLGSTSGAATLLWEVTFGQATIADPAAANTTLTANAEGTIRLRLTATIPSAAGGPTIATREFEIAAVNDLMPQVLIETNFGNITIELNGAAAPLHTANFLLYVDDGFYVGLLFHRNVCSPNAETGECDPFVLQGGGYERVNGELTLVPATRDPVQSEADNGLSNGGLYSVALALSGGDPNSGATQFFFNLSEENTFLDDRGFTVFGQVVEGTNVIDSIVAMETVASPIIPGEVSLPAEDVIMERVVRMSNGN